MPVETIVGETIQETHLQLHVVGRLEPLNSDMRWLYSIFICFVLCSCLGASSPSDDVLTQTFVTYERRFLEVESFCYNQKNLRSIKFENSKLIVSTESGAANLNSAEELLLGNFFRDTKMSQIDCRFVYSSSGIGRLFAVRFIAYAVGMGFSGRIKAIDHFIDGRSDLRTNDIARRELRKLPKEGWYIYEPK